MGGGGEFVGVAEWFLIMTETVTPRREPYSWEWSWVRALFARHEEKGRSR